LVLSPAIAGLRVELRCNDQGLADQLQGRYQQYLAFGTPHLTPDIRWSGRSYSGSLADASPVELSLFHRVSMTFADETLYFNAPGYDGAVDVKQGRAWLQFSSAVGGVLAHPKFESQCSGTLV
jgi:hypothetical protein